MTTSSIIPRDQIPYFVIRGDECCLTWLIKQIMLIFQSCRQQDTINTYIPTFNRTNIRWLSKSQIEGLPAERIEQLSVEQLNAFTDVQKSYFTDSQRAAFEGTLRQSIVHNDPYHPEANSASENGLNPSRTQESESGLNPFETQEQVPITNRQAEVINEEIVDDEEENIPSSPPQQQTSSSEHLNQPSNGTEAQHLRRTDAEVTSQNWQQKVFGDYLHDSSMQESINEYLPASWKSFLSNPKVQQFFEDNASYKNYSMGNLGYLAIYHDFLSKYTLMQFLPEAETETPLTEEEKENIISILSEEDREVLHKENEIRSIPEWETRCKNIKLNNLKEIKFLITPNNQLLKMPVRDCGHLSPSQARVLFLKLNRCLEGNQENSMEERPLLLDETKVFTLNLPNLTIHQFRSLSIGKIHQLLPQIHPLFLCLLSPIQLQQLDTQQLSKPQFQALFHERCSAGRENIAQYLLNIFSGAQINAMQHHLSGDLLGILNEEKTWALDLNTLTEAQVNEWINNHPHPQSMLDKLDPYQIPSIQDRLTGLSLQHLSEDHTHALNVFRLTQTQVDEWINNHPHPQSMLDKLDPDQIPEIQGKLTGLSLQCLSEDHTHALDVSTLTEAQVNEWINDNRTKRAVMLGKLSEDQIPHIQDKLAGSTLQHLSEDYTHLLHVSELTQGQVDEWINHYRAPSVMLNKLIPDQIPGIQNKLTFASLKALSQDHAHKLNVNADGISDLKLQEMFQNNPFSQISPKLSELQRDTLQCRLQKLGINT